MIASGTFSGRFDLRVYDAHTGQLTKSRSFPNLITDAGLSTYCGSGVIDYSPYNSTATICVGKGTNAPSPLDTALGAFFAIAGNNLSSNSNFNGGVISPTSPDWICGTRGTCRFNAGVFNGDAITEVGVCGRGNGKLWSRALILDEQGQPSAITILDNEYLDATYTLYYHPPLTDTSFSFVMNGVTYTCTARAALVSNQVFSGFPLTTANVAITRLYGSQTLGDVTSAPSGAEGYYYYSPGISAALPYDSSNPFSSSFKSTIARNVGNFTGGIGSVLIQLHSTNVAGIDSRTQISFTPKLPKDANSEITLTFAKTISRYVAPSP